MWLKEYYEVLGAATKKAQAYTDQEVGKVRTKFAVVASYADLPNPGRTDTIYLVPKAGFVSVYDQYIYENNQYTDIGDTELDLDSYATDLELSQGLATKVDKVEGYGLSKNDFTDAKDTKLAGIETGAQVNVTPDATLDETSTNAIQNKAVAEKFEEVEAEILNEDKVAEGNPITIQTGSIGTAKSTELTMLPIQDLHGYNNPWVGGAGKNLLQLNSHGSNYNITPYGIEVSDYDSANSYYIMQNVSGFAAGTYTVNDYAGGGSASTHRLRVYKNGESIGYASETKFNFTIESAEDVIDIRLYTYQGNTTQLLKPQIEAGSNTTSYEPYSNICPISGRTQAEILKDNENVLKWSDYLELPKTNNSINYSNGGNGKIIMSGTASALSSVSLIPNEAGASFFKPNTTYYFKLFGTITGITIQLYVDDISVNYADEFSYTFPTSFTTARVRIRASSSTVLSTPLTVAPMISVGSTAPSEYVANNRQTVTITFGQTVYGGTLNVETGELTIDTAIVDLGDLTWTASNAPIIFYADPRNLGEFIGAGKTIVCCDSYQAQANVNGVADFRDYANGSIGGFTNPNAGYHRIYIKDEAYSDASTFTTAVAGIYACYKLATPTTTTLTVAQVNLIKGINNISTDADSIKMTYTINDFVTETEMDTALESKANVIDLNGKADLTSFGPLEEIIASTNYAEGDYMIFEGKFCKASSAITAGDTLEIGTNLTETTIAAELLDIISQLPTT